MKVAKISLFTIAIALFCGGIYFAYTKSNYDKALDDNFLTGGNIRLRDFTSDDERILDQLTFGMISCFVLSGISGVAGAIIPSVNNSDKS